MKGFSQNKPPYVFDFDVPRVTQTEKKAMDGSLYAIPAAWIPAIPVEMTPNPMKFNKPELKGTVNLNH